MLSDMGPFMSDMEPILPMGQAASPMRCMQGVGVLFRVCCVCAFLTASPNRWSTAVGAVLQAAHERRVIVVDGFIATSAVVVAHALQPQVLQRCVFAHRSGERGHEFMLQHLGVQGLLDLGLRLGEGSGAAMAWPLLRAAATLMRDMASFESAGVSQAD